MEITSNASRQAAIQWAHEIAGLVQRRSDHKATAAIASAVEQFRAEKFQIAVLGKAKRGKSTLINALLGRRDDIVAPIDKLPASSAITRVSWAEADVAVVHYRDGRREETSFERIREFVTEEFNPENKKQVNLVDVAGPFTALDRDLVLVDTPGAASIHEHHDALLHAFIPQADAVIFLVTARMPLDQDELELLAQVKEADIRKVFFAINKIDELSPADLADAKDHNRRLLDQSGVPVERLYEISAKRAFQGDVPGSGLTELTTDMATFLAKHKGQILSERLVSRVASQATPVLQGLDVELASLRKSAAELEEDLRALQEKKRAIEFDRTQVEREFTLAWTRAVDRFEQELFATRDRTSAAIRHNIAETSVFETSSLARRFPTLLSRTIDDEFALPARTFEQAAREASERLQANYPNFFVGEAGNVAVRTREGFSFIAGSAGGVATAATGAGLAVAGSMAAAGISAANAAALAATTTVTAPSIASTLLTYLGLEAIAPIATGTAIVAAPGALTTTPLWVALAGPVGWTLAGIGLMAVPFSWRVSKLRLKDKLEEAGEKEIGKVFERLKSERMPALRGMGKSIVEEFQIRLERELQQIEAAMLAARDHRPDEAEAERLRDLADRLRTLLERHRTTTPAPREALAF